MPCAREQSKEEGPAGEKKPPPRNKMANFVAACKLSKPDLREGTKEEEEEEEESSFCTRLFACRHCCVCVLLRRSPRERERDRERARSTCRASLVPR